MIYFLDTDTCIYFLNGAYPKLTEHFQAVSPLDIKIPAIVKAELLFGVEKSRQRKTNREKYERFLQAFATVGFGDAAAEIYAVLRNKLEKTGKLIGPNDLLIASIVLAAGGTLVTHNKREFKRVPNLLIEDWTI
ncbi:MAG: type II toxin-antitoxin system VapC family toxin [Candidatus Margulisbacteria bacterium]|jgi:tRNA(fMet)-specific endonuclease VapC|nr:type II toxin-antitoxin system VapC family toxin [Candidatus Margulisiibacteriota bacterium]